MVVDITAGAVSAGEVTGAAGGLEVVVAGATLTSATGVSTAFIVESVIVYREIDVTVSISNCCLPYTKHIERESRIAEANVPNLPRDAR